MGWLRGPIGVVPLAHLDADLTDAPREALLRVLEEEGPRRIAAACALASRGDGAGFEVLVEGLSDADLRYPCLEAMRLLGDARAREPAARILRRFFVSRFDRTQAAGVLAALGDARGRAHILSRLRPRFFDEDRGLACELAGELKLEEATPALLRIAEAKTNLFRGAALKALMRIAPDRWEPRLLEIVRAEDEDEDVRCDCAEAVFDFGSDAGRSALEAVETQNEALRSVLSQLFAPEE